jgi:hypothetical protein
LSKFLHDSASIPVLRIVYFMKFESTLTYGIIFWDRVNDSNSVFKSQKKGLRLIKGVKNRVSCIRLFGDFKILTVTS